MRTVWSLALVGLVGFWPGTAARAQFVTRVDLDNDSFNFWQAPKARADREYTQGTRVNVLWPTANGFAARLLGGRQLCSSELATRDCRMMSLALVQAIYTPTLDLRYRTIDERPFAGWLGAEIGVQRDRNRSLTAISLALGVTGKASFAEPVQKAVHSTFGFRPPVGWERQLPTEVAFVAAYRGAFNALRLEHRRTGLRVFAAPVWSARLGTLATDATVGVQLTAGVRAPVPWQTAPNVRGDRWGLFVRGGVAQSAVGRNLFLDGSTFSDESQRVPRNTLVSETEVGIGLRSPIGLVEWRVHSRGREYREQPLAHAYSTFSFALR
jgi:lipid A 3-O-deacylase